MPKYSITNAQFSPFSFEEMVRPYQLATEKYEKQVDAFNKLAEDIDAVDYLAQSLPDESPYKKQFNAYVEQFNKAGDTLSQGWSPDTASSLMNLRRMYHNTLVPIQKADQIRTKTADTQNAMRAKDPTIRFEVDAADPNSLDYFLDNPGTPAIKSYSQNAILQSAASQIKNLKEQLYQNNSFEALGEEGKLLAQNTLSQEDVAKIIQNPELYPNISSIINTAIDASGLSNWSDAGKEQEASNAWNTALSGMSLGLSVAENPNFIPASKQIEYGLKQRQLDIQALKAARSGWRSSRTNNSSDNEQQLVITKGDQTRVYAKEDKVLGSAGYPSIQNIKKQVGTKGIQIANNTADAAESDADSSAEEISPQSVLQMYSGNTYSDLKARSFIADKTKGYLDAFRFYALGNDVNGTPMLLIKAKSDDVVGDLYNYSNEGYNPDFRFSYTSEDAFTKDINSVNTKENREEARQRRMRLTYTINADGKVQKAFIPPENDQQIGQFFNPAKMKNKNQILKLLQRKDKQNSETQSTQSPSNTNVPIIP